jgi:hypothetical protein
MKSLPKLRQALRLVIFCFAVSSCSSEAVTLVNLNSGATTKCSASGAGLGIGWATTFLDTCIDRYEKMGYLRLDELTAEQRADLQRRGVLPTD